MVHTLGSDAFAGAIRAPSFTGLSPLFRAKIRVDDRSIRCYVKPMPDEILCPSKGVSVGNREIINEALGYVLARACGFQVPETAGVILLELDQLPSQAVDQLKSFSSGPLQSNYLCWFSQDMAHPNLVQRHLTGIQVQFLAQRRLKRLVKHLVDSDDSPKLVAFDDWLLNSDRHPGNLLAPGGNSIMLIDHGRILNFPNWSPGGVGSTGRPFANRLLNFIEQHEPNWSAKLPKSSAIILAYNAFALSFREKGEAEARSVLNEFFDEIDIEAIIDLLRSRHDPKAYAKANGMIL